MKTNLLLCGVLAAMLTAPFAGLAAAPGSPVGEKPKRVADETWPPPHGAHVGNYDFSAFCVHDGKNTAFVIAHHGDFDSTSRSSSNAKARTWTDSVTLTAKQPGITLSFHRTHTAPGNLSLTTAPAEARDLSKPAPPPRDFGQREYDLAKGRVFLLSDNGTVRQLDIAVPPVRDRESADKLAKLIAAIPPQAREDIAQPKLKNARELYEIWQRLARANGDIPGALIGELAAAVKQFITYNPTWETVPQLNGILPRLDASRDWTAAETIALLDELAAVKDAPLDMASWRSRPLRKGEKLPEKFADANWHGAPGGLRVAWVLEPVAAEYRIGTALRARLLVWNPGAVAVALQVPTFHQGGITASDAKGAEVEVVGLHFLTLADSVPVRLGPGEFIEINTPGVGIGERAGREPWAGPRVGFNVLAKPGTDITLKHSPIPLDGSEGGLREDQPRVVGAGWWLAYIKSQLARQLPLPAAAAERTRLLERAVRDLFGTAPTAEEIAAFTADQTPGALDELAKRLAERADAVEFAGSLPPAPVKFRVLSANSAAEKIPRVALGPGEYPLPSTSALRGNATLKIVGRPVGERVVNDTKIIFEATEATGKLPPEPYKFEIPDGWGNWAIVCRPSDGFFYILHQGTARKIDFRDPRKVTDTPATDVPAGFREEAKQQLESAGAPAEKQAEVFEKPAPPAAEASPRSDEARLLPKHEYARSLLKNWQTSARTDGKIPGALVGQLAEQVEQFTKQYPKDDATPKLAAVRPKLDASRDWTQAEVVAVLDEITALTTAPVSWADIPARFDSGRNLQTGQPLPVELESAAWGAPAESGLRAAWLLEPKPIQMTTSAKEVAVSFYRFGSVLKARVLFHNAGKEPVVFATETWHQADGHTARDAKGAEIPVKATWFTGITPMATFRLAPGEYCEVSGHGIAIGAGEYKEEFSTGTVGAIIEAKEGEVVTLSHTVDAAHGGWTKLGDPKDPAELRKRIIAERVQREAPLPRAAADRELLIRRVTLDLTGVPPTPEEIAAFTAAAAPDALEKLITRLQATAGQVPWSGKLPTGETKFRVLAADPDAAKKPRTANAPGRYVLGEGVHLQVRQVTEGGKRTNSAEIIFFGPDPKKESPHKPHNIALPDGLNSYCIIWERGAGSLMVVERGSVRTVDFSNPVSVQESRAKVNLAPKYKALLPPGLLHSEQEPKQPEPPKGAAVKLTPESLLGFWRGKVDGKDLTLSFHRPPVEKDVQLDVYEGEATIGSLAKFTIAADGGSALVVSDWADSATFGTLRPGEAETLKLELHNREKGQTEVVLTRDAEPPATEPRQAEARALFELWKTTANDDGTIPGTFIGKLATEVRAYVKANPTYDSAAKFPKLLPRFVTSRDWTPAEAIKLLDDVAYYATGPIAARVVKSKEWSSPLWRTEVEFQDIPVQIAKWSEAKDGLRIGMRVVEGDWRIGGEARVELWLHNAGGKDVSFKSTGPSRQDVGVAVAALDAEGREHWADNGNILIIAMPMDCTLPAGHVAMAKSLEVTFAEPGNDVKAWMAPRFRDLKPGKYQLRCKWVDANATVSKPGDWTGELTAPDFAFTLGGAAADAGGANPAPKLAKLPDDSYAKVGVKLDDIPVANLEWCEEQNGMCVGLLVPENRDWRIGGEVKVELWVCNAGEKDVKFQHCPRRDSGLRVLLKGADGKQHAAEIARFDTWPVFSRALLSAGHAFKAKEFSVVFLPPGGKHDGAEPHFTLPAGDYKFRTEVHLPGTTGKMGNGEQVTPAAGEWSGTIKSTALDVRLVAADGAAVKPDVKPVSEWAAVNIEKDGAISLEREKVTLDELKARAVKMAKKSFTIHADKDVPYAKVIEVVEALKAADVTEFGFAEARLGDGKYRVANRQAGYEFDNKHGFSICRPREYPQWFTVSWPAEGERPKCWLRTYPNVSEQTRGKWAVVWEPGTDVLWWVDDSDVGKMTITDPAHVIVDREGRTNNFSRDFGLPEEVKTEFRRLGFVIGREPVNGRVPIGGNTGGQSIVSAEVGTWSIKGAVTDADGKPLADVPVRVTTNQELKTVKTNAKGEYYASFALPLQLLAHWRGVTVEPVLEGFTERGMAKAGQFNVLLRAGEQPQRVRLAGDEDFQPGPIPLSAERALIPSQPGASPGNPGRADFVMIKAPEAEKPAVPAEEKPAAKPKAASPIRARDAWSAELLALSKVVAESRGMAEAKAEDVIAWGAEADGLRSGLLLPGRAKLGETVTPLLVLKNVSDATKDLKVCTSLNVLLPTVHSADGKTFVETLKIQLRGADALFPVTLKAGEHIEFAGPPVLFGVERGADGKPQTPKWPVAGVVMGAETVRVKFHLGNVRGPETGEVTVEVKTPGKVIRGKLLKPDGTPAAGVAVRVDDGWERWKFRGPGIPDLPKGVTTATDGTFSIAVAKGSVATNYEVFADSDAFAPLNGKVPEGGDLGVMQFAKGSRVTGRVIGLDGAGLAKVGIWCKRLDWHGRGPAPAKLTSTGADGTFSIPPIATGRYILQIITRDLGTMELAVAFANPIIEAKDDAPVAVEVRPLPTVDLTLDARVLRSKAEFSDFELRVSGTLPGHKAGEPAASWTRLETTKLTEGRHTIAVPTGLQNTSVRADRIYMRKGDEPVFIWRREGEGKRTVNNTLELGVLDKPLRLSLTVQDAAVAQPLMVNP